MTADTDTHLDASTEEALDGIAQGLSRSSRSPVLRTPADAGLAFEDVSYPSADGVPLEAWFIPCEGSDRLVVAMHAFGFNRYGFPAHLEPWRSAFGAGNDTEIDFIRDYEILHDNGYNVLAFDFRNFGLSGDANGAIQSCNRFEARDVIGTMRYIRSRPDLAGMRTALFARCMGANATFRAIHTAPEEFADVSCLVAPLLLSTRVFVEATLDKLGLSGHGEEVDRRFHDLTGAWMADAETSTWAPAVTLPTLTYGVRDDHVTRSTDLETTFEAIGAEQKSLFWIEDSDRRWDGYLYFQRHPERVLEWFDRHMTASAGHGADDAV